MRDILERGRLYLELWYFIRRSKKWWLIPILIPLVVTGALMLDGANVQSGGKDGRTTKR
jgi:Family of unknown function (DUF5989)